MIIIGLIDLCKNVEWKCIYIVMKYFLLLLIFLNVENEYIFNVLYGKVLDCVV